MRGLKGGSNLLTCFFSSRRRHTRFDCDWSSDVCSSDLLGHGGHTAVVVGGRLVGPLAIVCRHFHHGQAVDGEFLVHFGGRAGQGAGAAVAVDEERAEFLVGGGFVVHGQHSA